jgi:hypothetical protein
LPQENDCREASSKVPRPSIANKWRRLLLGFAGAWPGVFWAGVDAWLIKLRWQTDKDRSIQKFYTIFNPIHRRTNIHCKRGNMVEDSLWED